MEKFEAINRKIKQIQRSETKIKKRYVIILSTVAMTLVLVFWIVYLNFSLPSLPDMETVKKEEKQAPGDSFRNVFNRGFKIIGLRINRQVTKTKNDIKEASGFFSYQLKKANEFNIDISSSTQQVKAPAPSESAEASTVSP